MGKKVQIEISFENIKDFATERFGDRFYKGEKPFDNYKWIWVRASERFHETLALDY